MKRAMRIQLFTAAVFCLLIASGCVQMPTEKQSVADMRPTISFRLLDGATGDAKVYVDEIEAGTVGEYIEGTAALRVLPGTHVVRVVLRGNVLLNQRVYLGDGVNRAFIIN